MDELVASCNDGFANVEGKCDVNAQLYTALGQCNLDKADFR